jgi:hypothetical protein
VWISRKHKRLDDSEALVFVAHSRSTTPGEARRSSSPLVGVSLTVPTFRFVNVGWSF